MQGYGVMDKTRYRADLIIKSFDGGHLTKFGACALGHKLAEWFANINHGVN